MSEIRVRAVMDSGEFLEHFHRVAGEDGGDEFFKRLNQEMEDKASIKIVVNDFGDDLYVIVEIDPDGASFVVDEHGLQILESLRVRVGEVRYLFKDKYRFDLPEFKIDIDDAIPVQEIEMRNEVCVFKSIDSEKFFKHFRHKIGDEQVLVVDEKKFYSDEEQEFFEYLNASLGGQARVFINADQFGCESVTISIEPDKKHDLTLRADGILQLPRTFADRVHGVRAFFKSKFNFDLGKFKLIMRFETFI